MSFDDASLVGKSFSLLGAQRFESSPTDEFRETLESRVSISSTIAITLLEKHLVDEYDCIFGTTTAVSHSLSAYSVNVGEPPQPISQFGTGAFSSFRHGFPRSGVFFS